MSFLIIVLSQSNTAKGRPPGSPEQVPRASMTVWMRWAFAPYHGWLSLGQAPDCAPADPAVAKHAAMTNAAAGRMRLTPGRVTRADASAHELRLGRQRRRERGDDPGA